MLPRKERRQKGSQAGLLSGGIDEGWSTLPGAVQDTVTVLCVMELPSIKQSFFFLKLLQLLNVFLAILYFNQKYPLPPPPSSPNPG